MSLEEESNNFVKPRYVKPEHYKYHVLTVPDRSGQKRFFYYKRYVPTAKTSVQELNACDSAYDVLQVLAKSQGITKQGEFFACKNLLKHFLIIKKN
jgi:hypothetical protein